MQPSNVQSKKPEKDAAASSAQKPHGPDKSLSRTPPNIMKSLPPLPSAQSAQHEGKSSTALYNPRTGAESEPCIKPKVGIAKKIHMIKVEPGEAKLVDSLQRQVEQSRDSFDS